MNKTTTGKITDAKFIGGAVATPGHPLVGPLSGRNVNISGIICKTNVRQGGAAQPAGLQVIQSLLRRITKIR